MGAIAVSRKEEQQIESLRKKLKIPTKSGLIRVALKTLEQKTAEDRLRREVQESVRRCAAADKVENRELHPAGIVHLMGSPANANRLQRAIRQLEAGKGRVRKLIR